MDTDSNVVETNSIKRLYDSMARVSSYLSAHDSAKSQLSLMTRLECPVRSKDQKYLSAQLLLHLDQDRALIVLAGLCGCRHRLEWLDARLAAVAAGAVALI